MADAIWAAIIGGLIGLVSTYVVAVVKVRQDLRAKYDIDLRERRIPEYKELWKLTDMFPKYGRGPNPTAAGTQALSVALRDWYFAGGGMLLSIYGRYTYFALQEALNDLPATDDGQTMGDATYECLRQRGSDLRTALVRDVGTRRDPVEIDVVN